MHDNQEQTELAKRARNGDRDAFGLLFDMYVEGIYRFIYYRMRDREAAEDITSDTFMKALQRVKDLEDAKRFKSWLYRIAYTTLIDHTRKQKLRNHADIDEIAEPSTDEDIERQAGAKADLDRVEKELSQLKETERDIVIMRVWDELSYEEIAHLTGKTKGNCKVIFSRSVGKLRERVPLALLLLLFTHHIHP